MFRDGLLAGKRVLITGGATGLGKSIGERYVQLGAQLVLCGRRGQILQQAAEDFRSLDGVQVETHACDVRDAGAVQRMMNRIWEKGALDLLVNNAAGNFPARTERLSPRAVDAVIDIVLSREPRTARSKPYYRRGCRHRRRKMAAGRRRAFGLDDAELVR